MTADITTEPVPEGVYEHEGRLWRAKSGATSTFEESVEARALFLDLSHDQFWNPWRKEEQAIELARAMRIMEEWERAEPGFKQMTLRQYNAKMARKDREWQRERTKAEAIRKANLARHDPVRAHARLELLEQRSRLNRLASEFEGLRSGEAFPAMAPARRSVRVAELSDQVGQLEASVERLTTIVGDPEDVPNEQGYLPRDRRTWSHYEYQERRIHQILELRERLQHEARLAGTPDKGTRSKLDASRSFDKFHLDALLAVPRLEPEDMCADCASPAHGRGLVKHPFDWPCPAWPERRAALDRVMEILRAPRHVDSQAGAATSPQPKPQPLAVVPSGLEIAEVIQRLQELQQEYPEAQVRRGRANRWELWPKKADD